jgi:hypothetical protein
MDVAQHDALALVGARAARTAVGGRVVRDVAKDDAGVGGGDLDGGFDGVEGVRAEGRGRGPFEELEVAEGGELDGEVLEGVGRLVDYQDL